MAEYDIIVKQGSTFKRDIIYKNNGTPVDLTDYSARMQIRPSLDSLVLICNLSSDDDGITIDAENGKISLLIQAIETASFSALSGFYDLEIESEDGEVTRLLQGAYTLDREITR
jgi:hypothetical protein